MELNKTISSVPVRLRIEIMASMCGLISARHRPEASTKDQGAPEASSIPTVCWTKTPANQRPSAAATPSPCFTLWVHIDRPAATTNSGLQRWTTATDAGSVFVFDWLWSTTAAAPNCINRKKRDHTRPVKGWPGTSEPARRGQARGVDQTIWIIRRQRSRRRFHRPKGCFEATSSVHSHHPGACSTAATAAEDDRGQQRRYADPVGHRIRPAAGQVFKGLLG